MHALRPTPRPTPNLLTLRALLQADVQRMRDLNSRLKHQLAEQLEAAEAADANAAAAQEAQEEAARERARATELEVRTGLGPLLPLLRCGRRVEAAAGCVHVAGVGTQQGCVCPLPAVELWAADIVVCSTPARSVALPQEQLQQSSVVISELQQELRSQANTSQVSALALRLRPPPPAACREGQGPALRRGWAGSTHAAALYLMLALWAPLLLLQRLHSEAEAYAALKEAYDAVVRSLEDSQGTVARQQVGAAAAAREART